MGENVMNEGSRKTLEGDFFWGFILLLWILVLVIPSARSVFLYLTGTYPYPCGFVKFFILATMGDLLGQRIQKKEWVIPAGLFFKATLWGIIGMMITLVFTVYVNGAAAAQAAGLLPFGGSKLANAFFGSAVMNLTFAPMLYIYHKYGDLYIETKIERLALKRADRITVRELTGKVDWQSMVSFSWLVTCPLIWIPCHTVVLLLPTEYRVLASAFLSILLGIIVAQSKMSTQRSNAVAQLS